MTITRRLLLSMVALLVLAPAAFAQGRVIPTTTYIGFNPLGLPADIATAEIETGVLQGITLGGVGSYIDVDDHRFTTFDFKARYYPGEVVLRGFSAGITAGFTRFSNVVDSTRQSVTAPTIGLIADYNWLLGYNQHFLVGTGAGVKRVLASHADRSRVDIDRAVLTVRFIVGYAF